MSSRLGNVALEDQDPGTDWEVLDSRVSAAVQDIRTALEQALAAARDLSEWVERIHTLSTFMHNVESGLVEVRHQLQERPSGPRPIAVPVAVPRTEEPSPIEPGRTHAEADEEPVAAATETPEAESTTEAIETTAVTEGEQPADEPMSVGEATGSVHLEIESSESNIDLMVVERALRETPGVTDVDLLDYAGKRARVRVTIGEGQDTEEAATPERLAAQVQERLADLAWDSGLSVSPAG